MADIIFESDTKLEIIADGWEYRQPQNALGLAFIVIAMLAMNLIYLNYLEIVFSTEQLIAYFVAAGILYFFGIVLCLTQTIVLVDAASSFVSFFWRSWITLKGKSIPFSDISDVILVHELCYAGKGRYFSTFPIRFVLVGGECIEMTKELDLVHARQIASRAANLCRVPFEDQTLQITDKLLPRDVRSAFKMALRLKRSNLRAIHLFTALIVFLLASGLMGILVYLFRNRSPVFPMALCLAPWAICAVAIFVESSFKPKSK